MNSSPLVSVIINTYNRCRLVGRAITSVTNQTYTNLEIIIIDADSPDDTKQAVASIKDERIIYFRSPTRDASTCVNTGFNMARGEFIALLDDDDEWYPTKIEKQIELFKILDDSYGWVGCGDEKWDDKIDKSVGSYMPHSLGDVFLKFLYGTNVGSCGSSMSLIRKTAIEDVGGLISSLSFSTDYLFFLKLSTKYKFNFVPEVLAIGHINHIYQHTRGSVMKYTKQFVSEKIEVEEYILKEYALTLDAHPKYRYSYYSKLARMNSYLKNAKRSLDYFTKAVGSNPASVFKNIRLLGSVIYYLYFKNIITG